MTIIYHGTPITPNAAMRLLGSRAYCISFYWKGQVELAEEISPWLMYDNGAFTAFTKGVQINWRDFYEWLEDRLFHPGRWAVIPDVIDAGSQLQDALVDEWPHGERGAPVWHTGEPIDRLLRLCSKWPRVCIGSTDAHWKVGGSEWRARMDEVSRAFGNSWPVIHMLRGVAVVRDYPFRIGGFNEFGTERMAI